MRLAEGLATPLPGTTLLDICWALAGHWRLRRDRTSQAAAGKRLLPEDRVAEGWQRGGRRSDRPLCLLLLLEGLAGCGAMEWGWTERATQPATLCRQQTNEASLPGGLSLSWRAG